MQRSPIEWTTFTANPLKFRTADGRVVWACEKLSPGCKNCYADSLSHRYGGARRAGDWNAGTMATLTPFLDDAELHKMLTAKRIGGVDIAGSMCFIGDMTDIFGEWIPDELLDRLFSNVLEHRRDVTWQLLTKRSERARSYLGWRWQDRLVPRHIWIGVSVEDRQRRDRIDHLRQTPAARRFISFEPLLEDVADGLDLTGVDLAIWGGESGYGARPNDLNWTRRGIEVCRAYGTAPFVKQLGGVPMLSHDEWEGEGTKVLLLNARNAKRVPDGFEPLKFNDKKGGSPQEWPYDLRVREMPS